jgi:hypothetical protein
MGSEWQPITTAPRDKTDIIVFSQRHGIRVARYDPFSWGNSKRLEWFIALEHGCSGGTFAIDVTHWMPLPAPPVNAEDRGTP